MEMQYKENAELLRAKRYQFKKERFRSRLTVGRVARKVLAELDVNYHDRAFNDSEILSNNADREKLRLEHNLFHGNNQADDITGKQVRKSHTVKHMKIYREVLGSIMALQERRVLTLEEDQQATEEELEKKRAELAALRRRVAASLKEQQKKEDLLKRLNSLQHHWKEAEHNAAYLRAVTLSKAKKMMHEARRQVSESKLTRVQSNESLCSSPTFEMAKRRRPQTTPGPFRKKHLPVLRRPTTTLAPKGLAPWGDSEDFFLGFTSVTMGSDNQEFACDGNEDGDDSIRTWHSKYSPESQTLCY